MNELDRINDAIDTICTHCTPDPNGDECEQCNVRKIWSRINDKLNNKED